MTWLIWLAALPALAMAYVLGFVIRRLARRFGLVDRPGGRKLHKTPVPLGGGVAIWLAVLLTFALGQTALLAWEAGGRPYISGISSNAPLELQAFAFISPHLSGLVERSIDLWVLLGAASLLMLLGLIDDRRGLDWRLRLAVQTAVAAAVVWGCNWRFTLFIDAPTTMAVLSTLWIVGLVNSFNMLDNMDGLSAGVAAICASMLAGVQLLTPNGPGRPHLFVSGLLLVLVGALVGFLWHNRPPARLFMGDAGSYFIGFLIGVATILATFAGRGHPPHAVLSPLCILAVPLYDTVSVVGIRLRAGRSPFEGDQNHFSHRLVALGLTKTQAVLTIYLATAACGLGALVLDQLDAFGAAAIVLSIACLLGVIAILETTARRRF